MAFCDNAGQKLFNIRRTDSINRAMRVNVATRTLAAGEGPSYVLIPKTSTKGQIQVC